MRQSLLLALLCLALSPFAQKKTESIAIIGVGDVMLGTTYPGNSLPPGDGHGVLTAVTPYLKKANLTFGNYEGALFDGTGVPKTCTDTSKCFAFKTPERYAAHLQKAGFSVMSVANNHSGDFGEEGRVRTIAALQNAGIAACGTVKQPYTIVEKNGVTYGIAAFAPNKGTQDINDYQSAGRIVAALNRLCDIVVVSFHGGAEGADKQHVPRQAEWFLGENRGDVYRFARVVIDSGADVVFGHGPHVSRAIDLYKGRFIAYSMGNFATYGKFSLKGDAGIAPIVKVYVNKKGQFLKGQIIPIRQVGAGRPRLDSSGAVVQKIKALTAQDFPESALVIHADGAIRPKPKKKEKQAT